MSPWSVAEYDLPSALTHSWPLFEKDQRFDLGCLCDGSEALPQFGRHADELAERGIGLWECDLQDNKLTWSSGVFDLFGLQRGTFVARTEAVAFYEERSRATMERLRAHAIKHRRGFTIDAQIVPANGPNRWMRLIAAPICVGPRVVRLHGIKMDVDADYI